MKKSKLFRCCTAISVAACFILAACTCYWCALGSFILAGGFATAWLVTDHYEWTEQQKTK